MIKNYIKTSFRNLWKNRSHSFLNIAGLGIGIACAALIYLWVEDELNYNHHFANRKNLYKVKDQQTYDGTTYVFDATPGKLAEGIKTEIPGIKRTSRATWNSKKLFSAGDKSINEEGYYVDPSFLSMFELKFIKGNAIHAFDQLRSLVITEKMAIKFFGNTEVTGQTLKVDNQQDYIITGVVEDMPTDVSIQFEWLSPFKIYEDNNEWLQQWGSNGIITYVETEPNANIEAINKMMFGFVQTKKSESIAHMFIYPMERWRLYDTFDNGKETEGRIKYVHLFSIIAWIILLIACINFMNLATARSEQRAREVGVRKVLGAGKSKLIAQFIGESLIMAFIAALLSVLILVLVLPAFNGLVEKELSANIFKWNHLSALMGISLLCGLFAGSYPAFYLSSFNPVQVLKGLKLKTNVSAVFVRKGLVILQFSISIILIISTMIIYRQVNHIRQRNLGYNRQELVYLPVEGNVVPHFNAIKYDLQKTGFVENAALSRSMVLQLGSNTGDFNWEGKDPNKQVLITVESVSPEYISTMGMKVKEGRDFYSNIKSDSNNVIINESFAKIINRKNIVGSTVTWGDDSKYTIVGVVNDFVYNNMYGTAAPLILFTDTTSVNYLTVRFKPNSNLSAALPAFEKVMKANNPGYLVEYKFVDESFDQYFKTEKLIGKLAAVFSILAIVISCLGLFGLAAYTAERRTKEIGIRKVLGASVNGLATLLSKDFLILVLISCFIAFPVSYWMMHNWLNDYDYRVAMSWWIFVAAGLLAILIALITVSYQAIKVALTNPVKSLRNE
ncbi:MAG: ABC transporter permease [Bacteroidetes bacterium]|nr:ABC transporter permease [Bacteroidota bacterium]